RARPRHPQMLAPYPREFSGDRHRSRASLLPSDSSTSASEAPEGRLTNRVASRIFFNNNGTPQPAGEPRVESSEGHGVRPTVLILCVIVLGAGAPLRAPGAEPPATQAEFFEQKIRPLLSSRCFECHGPKKHKGGLRLDSRSSILTGGDSGPALVPG